MVDMMEPSLAPILRWFVLGLVCALPTLLSVVGLVAHQRGKYRRRGSWLPQPAGPWLEEQVRRLGVPVTVEIHAREGMDAYVPGVGAIGLSQQTWGGCRPGHWAIAAHELGHALNMRLHPFVAQLLPTARLAQHHLWRAFCAALCCAALLRDPALLAPSFGLLVGSVLVSMVVCADELGASVHGFHLLQADQRVRGRDRWIIGSSMVSAGWVYALALAGQMVVLACWPSIAAIVPEVVPAPAFEPSPIALWLFVLLVPILLLRAAHVLIQVLQPEPVTTDFRLFTVMHREGQWEFMAGIGVMALVVGLHPLLADPLGSRGARAGHDERHRASGGATIGVDPISSAARGSGMVRGVGAGRRGRGVRAPGDPGSRRSCVDGVVHEPPMVPTHGVAGSPRVSPIVGLVAAAVGLLGEYGASPWAPYCF